MKIEKFKAYSPANELIHYPLRQLFLDRHNVIPSEFHFLSYFKNEDINKYVSENTKNVISTYCDSDGIIWRGLLHFFNSDKEFIYVCIDYAGSYQEYKNTVKVTLFFAEKTEWTESVIDTFTKLTIPQSKNEGYLNLLVKTDNGFGLEKCEIAPPEIDFDINYNQDFKPIDELIKNKLSVKNSKGLVLLHGLPGTGKTTYIRHLINNIDGKKIIYIPPSMTSFISDPELIKFFIKNSNSILVIEDAENILINRGENSSQAIANILNLTDGLLSDCANIQIVATFNTDLLNIDSALLRKGRLIARYEFRKLEEDRVLKLAKKLGCEVNGSLTLADIYNSEEKSFTQKSKSIGFNK